MTYSRRAFLRQTSAAAVSGLYARTLAPGVWSAAAVRWPEPDEALMRRLSLVAVDAARQAGAAFADVRMTLSHSISMACYYVKAGSTHSPWPMVTMRTGFGVRAIVDGSWGFASGCVLMPDSVAEIARAAVNAARINRPRKPRVLDLAPAPKVDGGEWATPIERDPWSVPIREQRAVIEHALAGLKARPAIGAGQFGLEWRRSTAVFASTEGSMILQRFHTALPSGEVSLNADEEEWLSVSMPIASLRQGPYGYEALAANTLDSDVLAAADRAIEVAKRVQRRSSVEVGRYDLVLGAPAVASLVELTLASALNLRRALGYEANHEGTSFAAPPEEMLGRTQIGASFLTLRGDRTQPKGAATVGWDEEGVKPEAYTFIKDGTITDYHNDRQTAMEIAGAYRARGAVPRAQGIARRGGEYLPVSLVPNVTMEPGRDGTTVDDLIAGTKRGLYIEGAGGVVDQQVLNAQCGANVTRVRRITNGRLGDHVNHVGFQLITPQFWKRADGIGGAGSVKSIARGTDWLALSDPAQPFPLSTFTTVPMRMRDVNVLNVGRRA